MGIAFGVGALSLAGMVPLALWATKEAVLAVALDESPALYAVALAASLLSAAYAGKALFSIWRAPRTQGGDQHDGGEKGTGHIGLWQRVALLVLAFGAAVLGVLALPPLGRRLREALGEGSAPVAGWVELTVAAVLAIAVLFLMAKRRAPEPRWAAQWLGLERSTHAWVVRPTLRLAERAAHFDDRVLDRGVMRAAGFIAGAARRTARLDDRRVDAAVERFSRSGLDMAQVTARADLGLVDSAVESLAVKARRFGSLARRPQTGQLHHYYAQAAAVLAAAAVLLLIVR